MDGVFLLLNLCLLAFATSLSGDDRKKALFNDISEDSSLKDCSMTSMLHKSFHQCSIEGICSFVIKNLKTNEFKKINSEKDLPKNRKGFRLWQKYQSLLTDVPNAPGVLDIGTKKKMMMAPSMLRDRSMTKNITGKFIFDTVETRIKAPRFFLGSLNRFLIK